ncbi:hypothetical protein [Agitococcus lubricus]|uniref:Uncharacterized protein n=1 Tax=Agitococcus lubricus TaxID=1077255 RepID=A0A2T5IZ81_9GAMM|nr:hypothetical protein [Agitococcus lubricus]PTQ89312.1 hypothetical protein C8N29_10745 [Agitococcus lubricus]
MVYCHDQVNSLVWMKKLPLSVSVDTSLLAQPVPQHHQDFMVDAQVKSQ